MIKKTIALILALALLSALAGYPALAGSAADTTLAMLEYINSGEYEKALAFLNDEGRQLITADVIAEGWNGMAAQFGALVDYSLERESDTDAVIMCTHENGQTRFTCVFDEDGKVTTFNIVPTTYGTQEPIALELPAGAVEESVKLFEGSEKELNGLITLPEGYTSDTPVVVLVQGSGPSDMDETIGPCKPFRDIAYGLCENGIASIRHDKMTYAHPELFTQIENFTIDFEVIDPALEALKLANKKGFENAYVLGHSLGGMLTPVIMSKSEGGFKAGVILAGSPRKLYEIMYDQSVAILEETLGEADAVNQAALDEQLALARDICAMTREEALDNSQVQMLSAMGMPAFYLWSLDRLDEAAIALENDLPLLLLQGEDDFQVRLDTDFQAWKSRLGEDNPLYTYISYPGLSHLFMPSREGYGIARTVEAYMIPSLVDDKVIEDICEWIKSI